MLEEAIILAFLLYSALPLLWKWKFLQETLLYIIVVVVAVEMLPT
jgi:hypothetical protein